MFLCKYNLKDIFVPIVQKQGHAEVNWGKTAWYKVGQPLKMKFVFVLQDLKGVPSVCTQCGLNYVKEKYSEEKS